MKHVRLVLLALVLAPCLPAAAQNVSSAPEAAQAIYRQLRAAAHWQLQAIADSGWRHPIRDWTNAALFEGLMSFSGLAPTPQYLDVLRQAGEAVDWTLIGPPKRYMADDYAVGQTWAQLAAIDRDPRMIRDLERLADTLLARPHTESLA